MATSERVPTIVYPKIDSRAEVVYPKMSRSRHSFRVKHHAPVDALFFSIDLVYI